MRTKRNIIYKYRIENEIIYLNISVGKKHVILEEYIPCGLDRELLDDYINMRAFQKWRDEKAKDRGKWLNLKNLDRTKG